MPSFDAENGTDTDAAVSLDQLTIGSANAGFGYPYQPTPEGVLLDAIAFLEIDPAKFCFIDLGCGKGRTLITACKLGFEWVEGVEFAAELVSIARENLARCNLPHCSVRLGDAAEYEFSRQNLVVYVFNSFAEPVLEAVIHNLLSSNVEDFYLVYRNPSDPDLLHDCTGLQYLGCPPKRGGPGGVHVWTRASATSGSPRAPRPPRTSFELCAGRGLEPFQAAWSDLGPNRCDTLIVRVAYRQASPIVEHALVCGIELDSPPEPELLRRAKLAQSKHFSAFDYFPEPASGTDATCSSELRVRFGRAVTVSRIALARWSNAGPITIDRCTVKVRSSPF